jgi:hypothetical protein
MISPPISALWRPRRGLTLSILAGWLGMPGIAHADPDEGATRATNPRDPTGSDRGAAASPAPGPAPAVGDTSVDVLCRAAVALALAEPDRARGFVNRARLAGWLPELRFRVYRRFARTEGLSFNDAGVGVVAPVDISAIDDVRYEWRATWDLSRIVFNPDELQAHSEALRMSDVRRDIQSLVIHLFFERKRLVAEAQLAGSPTSDAAVASARRSVRILEIESELDMLSGGAFSAGAPARREAALTP